MSMTEFRKHRTMQNSDGKKPPPNLGRMDCLCYVAGIPKLPTTIAI